MAKKITSILIVFALALTAGFSCLAAATDINFDLDTYAKSIYLVNIDTGRVAFEKNAQTKIYPASTTKIMSAALAMSLCDDLNNTVVTVPDDIWKEFEGIDISHAGLVGGEQLTMNDLIHAMLLQSANEAASTVAAYYGRDTFIGLMNEKARELGCVETHFTNPHGLYNEEHYTTAEDMYKIAKWAIEEVPGFWDISCKTSYTIPPTNKHGENVLSTTIAMQDTTTGYYTPYIKGIKTGTIPEAGRCLVSAAVKDGMTYLLVCMGCSEEPTALFWGSGNSVFTDTRRIYDWCFDNLSLRVVAMPDDTIGEIRLKYAAKKDYLMLYPEKELATLINFNSPDQPVVTYETDMPEYIKAPIENGQPIGTAKVFADGLLVGEVNLVSREAIEMDTFVMIMDKISELLTSKAARVIYVVLLLVVALYVFYILVYVPKARKGKKRKKISRK
ncbi:MAG: D-alanyl-D-alanine carboxypeptidase family protein [Oscillospiraceae bacterium]